MRSFASDNISGVHPQIMNAIVGANQDHAAGYGKDEWSHRADDTFCEIFGENIIPYFVFNGTGANTIALQAATRPFNSILCASTAHIYTDECGAPTHLTSTQLITIETPDGKLSPKLLLPHLHGFGEQHHSQQKVVYISQSTELGTIYSPEEISAICDCAHSYNMYVHVDGSRLANACARLGKNMREISRDCGVDILSLGGTKNGMMMGEAVIAFRPELAENLKYIRKQSTQLYSKMRYLSAQFIEYFHNGLWLENAKNANAMADYMAEQIRPLPGIQFTQKVDANSLFLTMPEKAIRKMLEKHHFYVRNEAIGEIRLVCSWDTTKEDIDIFVSDLIKTL
jgi:threonine aldolase